MKHTFKNTIKQSTSDTLSYDKHDTPFFRLLFIDELVYDDREGVLCLRLVNNGSHRPYQIYYSFYYPQLNSILSFLEGNKLSDIQDEQLSAYNIPFEIQYILGFCDRGIVTNLNPSTFKFYTDTSIQHYLNRAPLFARFATALGRPLDRDTELCLVDKDIINSIRSKISTPIYQEISPSGQMMNVKALIDKYAYNVNRHKIPTEQSLRVGEARRLALERSLQVSPTVQAIGRNRLSKFVCKTTIMEGFSSLKEITIFKLRKMKEMNLLPPDQEERLPEECRIELK